MKIKIKSHGPAGWQMSVTNAETGELIPVLWNDDCKIVIFQHHGALAALIEVVDIEVDVEAELLDV